MELIPGHYFFKYVTLGAGGDDENVPFKSGSSDGRETGEGDALGRKRLRQTSEANVSGRNSKVSIMNHLWDFMKVVVDNC